MCYICFNALMAVKQNECGSFGQAMMNWFLVGITFFYWTVNLYQVGRRRVSLLISEKKLKRGS